MGASPEMTADDVLGFLRLTKSLGVDIWIDGGWAVDACLGEQTRRHADLDIVIAQSDLETVVIELRVRGWKDVPRDDTRPWNFVLGDDRGHEVDFHVVVLDGKAAASMARPRTTITGRRPRSIGRAA